jgi:hypothetical protein
VIGKGDKDGICDSYIANLRYVLDHVETLLKNIDAEHVAILADHGNAKDEWGVYEYPLGIPIKYVKTVPWYTSTVCDQKTRKPSGTRTTPDYETEAKERLKQLGYVRSDY